jgi:hypothetical protein
VLVVAALEFVVAEPAGVASVADDGVCIDGEPSVDEGISFDQQGME